MCPHSLQSVWVSYIWTRRHEKFIADILKSLKIFVATAGSSSKKIIHESFRFWDGSRIWLVTGWGIQLEISTSSERASWLQIWIMSIKMQPQRGFNQHTWSVVVYYGIFIYDASTFTSIQLALENRRHPSISKASYQAASWHGGDAEMRFTVNDEVKICMLCCSLVLWSHTRVLLNLYTVFVTALVKLPHPGGDEETHRGESKFTHWGQEAGRGRHGGGHVVETKRGNHMGFKIRNMVSQLFHRDSLMNMWHAFWH